jgi:hypothetical protein
VEGRSSASGDSAIRSGLTEKDRKEHRNRQGQAHQNSRAREQGSMAAGGSPATEAWEWDAGWWNSLALPAGGWGAAAGMEAEARPSVWRSGRGRRREGQGAPACREVGARPPARSMGRGHRKGGRGEAAGKVNGAQPLARSSGRGRPWSAGGSTGRDRDTQRLPGVGSGQIRAIIGRPGCRFLNYNRF